jgi:cytochrome d ubiquinol oxidase subunit II
MVRYFRRRATGAGLAAGLVALAGLVVYSRDATYLHEGLTTRALPLVILSAVSGVGALVLLAPRTRNGKGARAAAVAAVGGLLLAWGVAQWDYVLPRTLTVSAGAAPTATIGSVLVASGLAVILIVPAFVVLYVLDQRTLLPEEGVPETIPEPDHERRRVDRAAQPPHSPDRRCSS